jgi:hypothetical protein
LLLHLVGTHAPERLAWKRLAIFDADDVRRVRREIGTRRHISVPNILTEASNLIGSGKQEALPGGGLWLANYCLGLDELYARSADAVVDPIFLRLGLTDAAIRRIAASDTKVLTVDHELAGRLAERGTMVVNLLHAKTPKRR